MAYFRSVFNDGRWGECEKCGAAPGERCSHLINSTPMVTVHEGRIKHGRSAFEVIKADYEERQEKERREAEKSLATAKKLGYIEPGSSITGATIRLPDQPPEKPPGAVPVRAQIHRQWDGTVIQETEYEYATYVPVWRDWVSNSVSYATSNSVTYTPVRYEIQNQIWREWTAIPSNYIVRGTYATGTGDWYNPQVWTEWVTAQRYALTQVTAAAQQAAVAMEPVQHGMARMTEAAMEARRRQEDARQARREAENRERLARVKRQKGARERANELLQMVLSAEERAYMEAHDGRILVRSQHGNLYEIDTKYGGVHGNITKVDLHGCILGRMCVAPRMYEGAEALPLEDGYVGQYLALRFNEDDIVDKANWSQVRDCKHPGVPILGQHRAA